MAITSGRGRITPPAPNLPSISRPWGDSVNSRLSSLERRVDILETSLKSLEKSVASVLGAIQVLNSEEV